MSLISDPDYLIHKLRLNYLRHADDPYGARILSFSPRYTGNANVIASGAAEPERWPELNEPQSPEVSDEESADAPNGRRYHTGFPGAKLQYRETIVGPNRSGGLGMRVTGKRAMTSNHAARPSISVVDATPKRTRAGSEPTPAAPPSTSPTALQSLSSTEVDDQPLIQVSKRRSAGGSSLSEIATTLVDKVDPEPESRVESQSPAAGTPMVLQSMSRIAAMQARRQRRRAHFTSAGSNDQRRIIVETPSLNPEDSSDEEPEGGVSESLPEDDYMEQLVEGEIEADEFDPVFAPPRVGGASDSSGVINSVSNSALSTSASSVYNSSSLQTGVSGKRRSRLSPVSEAHPSGHHRRNATNDSNNGESSDATQATVDAHFEMIKLPVRQVGARGATSREPSTQRSLSVNGKSGPSASPVDTLFTRRKVTPVRAAQSALSAKLASSNTSSNPFSELYALISGRAEVASMTVSVFFPHAQKPRGKPLELTVRQDATFEEVMGFALWSYWEEGWLPKLDEGIENDEQKKSTRLSAVGWIMRAAEDDGEVDEDCPAPDRMAKVFKFGFDAYAIIEATPTQIAQNQQLEAKIVRRPSRIIVAKRKMEPPPSLAAQLSIGPGTSAIIGSALGTSVGLSTLNISSSHGPQVFLRIRIAGATDTASHYSTTIPVTSAMYMQEVLEAVCRRRRLSNPKEWALLSSDEKILIPLDRTVASLEGSSELVLVPRSSLPKYGFGIDADRRTTGRQVDPNASIFRRVSEIQPKNKLLDLEYKRYTVYRKVPMLVARLERTLAIDGEYIHIMPSANKARGVFDSGKTVLYNIKSVVSCSQSSKASSSFKLIVKRDGGDKRYDFEAESSRLAAEIVQTVRGIRSRVGLERSGTVNKSRRSKHRA